jgi:hypothetical protein
MSVVRPLSNGRSGALAMAPLIPMAIGILMVFLGIGVGENVDLWTSGLGVIPVLGAVLIITAFGARQSIAKTAIADWTVGLALFVAVEFLAGVAISITMIAGIVLWGLDWVSGTLTVFGLLLTTDSLIFYRRHFGARMVDRSD